VILRKTSMQPGARHSRFLWTAVIFLSLIGATIAVRRIMYLSPILVHGYTAPVATVHSRAAQFAALDAVFARHPVLTMVHVLPGVLFMILGPLQFSSTIRVRHLAWHRISGRVFVVCGLIIGFSALLMSFTMESIGGVNQAAATILFGSFFLFALSTAFWHIRRGEITLHRQWMIRAFATGLAVATVRPIVGIFFATSRFTGLTPREFFGIAFWIGFVLQLIAAEAWIHRTMPRQDAPSLPGRFASNPNL